MTQQEKVIIEIEKIKEWFIRNSKHDCNNNAVLIDYTIPNVISLLEKQIEELKMAKVEEPQSKRWKPKVEELYFYVGIGGNIIECVWVDEHFDGWQYLTGNCFKTKEEAEEYKKQIEYTARYKNYIEEYGEPLDWNNGNQPKYFVGYDFSIKKISIYCNFTFQGLDIYASSVQIIKDAISEIGVDNFKKYVLGVK